MDFHIEAQGGGRTRIRLVQSGFGESEGWDDFFEGTKTGWAYFLYNLRLVLETHAGRRRHLISDRLKVATPRDAAWRHIAAAATGLSPDAVDGLQAGDRVRFAFDGGDTANAVVELVVPRHGLALRFPDHMDSPLFIELEHGARDSFHTGWWLSVYDATLAKALEAPAKRTFQRIHDTLPAQ
jgi:hypothetical protein